MRPMLSGRGILSPPGRPRRALLISSSRNHWGGHGKENTPARTTLSEEQTPLLLNHRPPARRPSQSWVPRVRCDDPLHVALEAIASATQWGPRLARITTGPQMSRRWRWTSATASTCGGHRRGEPRLPFMDAVNFFAGVDERPPRHHNHCCPGPTRRGSGPQAAGDPDGPDRRVSPRLILAIGVGVLMGRSHRPAARLGQQRLREQKSRKRRL